MAKTVCIIDAPWSFKTRSEKGAKKSPKYKTMSNADLSALGPMVRDLLGKDALVLAWVTAPQLANAFALFADWGLEYASWKAWKKDRLGTGYWVQSDAEILLIFKRGRPKPPPRGRQGRTIFGGAPVEKRHSSKPVCVHEWVESFYPQSRKIELFARLARTGWETYGDELGSLITPAGIITTSGAQAECQPKLRFCDTRQRNTPRAKGRSTNSRKLLEGTTALPR